MQNVMPCAKGKIKKLKFDILSYFYLYGIEMILKPAITTDKNNSPLLRDRGGEIWRGQKEETGERREGGKGTGRAGARKMGSQDIPKISI